MCCNGDQSADGADGPTAARGDILGLSESELTIGLSETHKREREGASEALSPPRVTHHLFLRGHRPFFVCSLGPNEFKQRGAGRWEGGGCRAERNLLKEARRGRKRGWQDTETDEERLFLADRMQPVWKGRDVCVLGGWGILGRLCTLSLHLW